MPLASGNVRLKLTPSVNIPWRARRDVGLTLGIEIGSMAIECMTTVTPPTTGAGSTVTLIDASAELYRPELYSCDTFTKNT